MIQAILTSIIGAASALLGVFLTQHFNAKKTESEEKRWFSDKLLAAKITALQNLYSSLDEAFFTLQGGLSNPPLTRDAYNETIIPIVANFNRADRIAKIYLDSKTESLMATMRSQLGLAQLAVRDRLQATLDGRTDFSTWPMFDFLKFSKTFDDAVARIGDILNPSVLRDLEKFD